MIPGSKKDMEILEKQECGEGIVEKKKMWLLLDQRRVSRSDFNVIPFFTVLHLSNSAKTCKQKQVVKKAKQARKQGDKN